MKEGEANGERKRRPARPIGASFGELGRDAPYETKDRREPGVGSIAGPDRLAGRKLGLLAPGAAGKPGPWPFSGSAGSAPWSSTCSSSSTCFSG